MTGVIEATASLASIVVAGVLLLPAIYLLFLTLASITAAGKRPPSAARRARRFAVLVPAHNEEVVLGRLLASLGRQAYPRHAYEVHVVADNCTDDTARIAAAFDGVEVHERFSERERAKGFALRWLLEQLRHRSADTSVFEGFLVLDADSVVAPDFLARMNARLASGSQVVQAYYSVLNARQGPLAALRFAALTAIHYVRPLGRTALGLSCGLKGNGMCFAAPVLEQFGWEWVTLAEDVEFHLALVKAGLRVDFAPEAEVLAEMPVSLAQAASQNDRWERGRLQLARSAAWPLVVAGARHGRVLEVDAGIEQLIPPLSVPFGLGLAVLGLSVAFGWWLTVGLALAGLGAYCLHLTVGLILAHAPLRIYASLVYAPVYIAWKIGVYARGLAGDGGSAWVRTARSQ